MAKLPFKRLIPTGISGLDDLFLGGIRNQNSILIEGMPGTGKTILALEFVYRGVMLLGEPCAFISLTTSRDQIVRDAAEFDWDLPALMQSEKFKIFEYSVQDLMTEIISGKGPFLDEIKRGKFKRVSIDGLRLLKSRIARELETDFGEQFSKFIRLVQSCGVMVLFTTDVRSASVAGQSGADDEQFIADTLISIGNSARGKGVYRFIEIVKSRGQEFFTGRHSFCVTNGSGIRVFPRASVRPGDFDINNSQMTSVEKSSVGIPALDEMLGGGVYTGSITLLTGISGTGKTVLATQFLIEGAKNGRKGILISMDEHPQQVRRNANSLGLELEEQEKLGNIVLAYDGPLELNLDVHLHTIKTLIETHKAERVVIDSLASYELVQPQEAREFIFALTSYLKRNLITAYYSYESPELLGVSQISKDIKASAIVDNIVLLSYVEISTLLRRAITVPKSRGSKPAQRTKEYVIQAGGINILDDQTVENVPSVPQLPLSSYYGVLARSPTRTSPVIDETLVSGKSLPMSHMPSPGAKRKKRSIGKSARN